MVMVETGGTGIGRGVAVTDFMEVVPGEIIEKMLKRLEERKPRLDYWGKFCGNKKKDGDAWEGFLKITFPGMESGVL